MRFVRNAVLLLVAFVPQLRVIQHEQVVDLLRDLQLRPLLLKRVPSASEGDLRKAHAYAYGGSLVLEFRAVA
jgi:hypothetical protein